jgi:hypothetical protein
MSVTSSSADSVGSLEKRLKSLQSRLSEHQSTAAALDAAIIATQKEVDILDAAKLNTGPRNEFEEEAARMASLKFE